jgi:putative tricarboxylic transport membrane protein
MGFLGAILIVRGIRARESVAWAEPFDWMRSPMHIANFLLVVGALIFYILVSDALGFAITAFITLYALLFWLRGRQFWLSSAAISLVSVIVLQQFFGQFLRVPLPWGVLEAYAW